jgi:hypothetical protein
MCGEIKYDDGNNVIVLVSGDRDMLPALEKVVEQGGIWSVQIVGLEATMSSEFKQFSRDNQQIVTIKFLNVEEFCFIQMKQTRKQSDQKTIAVDRLPFDFGDMDVHANGILLEDCRTDDIEWLQAKIPKWPFCYQNQLVPKPDHSLQTNILIVFISPNNPENRDVLNPHFVIDKVFPIVQYELKRYCANICTYAAARCTISTNTAEVPISNSFIPKVVELPVEKEEPFEPVKRIKSKKIQGKTSFPCQRHFGCSQRMKCTGSHTTEEIEFFKSGGKVKTRFCYHAPNCRRGSECNYAHTLEETFCVSCKLRGHLTENCSLKKDTARKN